MDATQQRLCQMMTPPSSLLSFTGSGHHPQILKRPLIVKELNFYNEIKLWQSRVKIITIGNKNEIPDQGWILQYVSSGTILCMNVGSAKFGNPCNIYI